MAVIPCYNGHKISGSQQYFLDRDGHLGEQTMEEKFGLMQFCSWVESCTGKSYNFFFSQFFLFFVFLPYLQDHVCWDAEILLQRARVYIFQWPFLWSSYLEGVVVIQCMTRLRKGENICVLFENPTHCSIGSAGRRHKCKEDHGNYRCSSQSWSCVFNCNDLL